MKLGVSGPEKVTQHILMVELVRYFQPDSQDQRQLCLCCWRLFGVYLFPGTTSSFKAFITCSLFAQADVK